jgi:hypothetical protein
MRDRTIREGLCSIVLVRSDRGVAEFPLDGLTGAETKVYTDNLLRSVRTDRTDRPSDKRWSNVWRDVEGQQVDSDFTERRLQQDGHD